MQHNFEGVKETPSEDGVVGIGHVHHIAGYILCAGI
jgi:hypothetical protein